MAEIELAQAAGAEDGRPLMLRNLAGKTADALVVLTAPLWLPGLLVLTALWARDNDPT